MSNHLYLCLGTNHYEEEGDFVLKKSCMPHDLERNNLQVAGKIYVEKSSSPHFQNCNGPTLSVHEKVACLEIFSKAALTKISVWSQLCTVQCYLEM